MTGTQQNLDVTPELSILDHSHTESIIVSEETKPDDTAKQSGHTVDVITGTHLSGSSTAVPDLNSVPVMLSASSMSITMPMPSVVVEASSPEIITVIPESRISSGATPLEDLQEGLREKAKIFFSTNQNITYSDVEQKELHAREGSGESSGDERPELASLNLSTDHSVSDTDAALPPDMKITSIPHHILTSGWEPESSSSAPLECHSDREYSAEPPITEESKEIPSSSINGEFNGILINS